MLGVNPDLTSSLHPLSPREHCVSVFVAILVEFDEYYRYRNDMMRRTALSTLVSSRATEMIRLVTACLQNMVLNTLLQAEKVLN